MLTLGALCWLCRMPVWFCHHGVCRTCVTQLLLTRPIHCPVCGLPAGTRSQPCGRCLLNPPLWHALHYVTDYQPPLTSLVKKLKYHGDTGLGRVLARLMLLSWLAERRQTAQRKPDMILNVPLHGYRHWRRGYNQTELLASPLARWLGVEYHDDILLRHRPAIPQQMLNARARQSNLQGAFSCSPDVAGRHVALVDDVVTTGSTVKELTRLLLAQQADTVEVWCVCRTL
ncbi:DNA utilization protein GntX [Biostraticola tofi]|uniref:ComF family protein n=1 Tax=Biostraticola tofi TaxID=466109 RepID=A0A4R3YQ04_9GAMM|nr:DNA utilization protein GntX [Biostraticola tofi]TCV93678.1 ComF family protein [Biostraticola tofi]